MRFRVWDAVAGAHFVLIGNRQRILALIALWAALVVLVQWTAAGGPLPTDGEVTTRSSTPRTLAALGAYLSAWICVCLASHRYVLLGENPKPIPNLERMLPYAGHLFFLMLPALVILFALHLLPREIVSDSGLELLNAIAASTYDSFAAGFALTLAAVAASKPRLPFLVSFQLTFPEGWRFVAGAAACVVPWSLATFLVERVWIDVEVDTPSDYAISWLYYSVNFAGAATWAAYISFAYLHFTRPGADKDELAEHFR